MPDAPRRLRRGVVVALAVVVVVIVVVGAVLVVRARQVDRSVEALCGELTEAQDLDQSLTTLDPATLDPQVDALRRAQQVAPADIEPAVATVADFVDELADEVADAEGPRSEALTQAIEARQDRVDEVTEAGTQLQAWAQTNCGLTLVGASTTTTSTPPTGAETTDTTGATP